MSEGGGSFLRGRGGRGRGGRRSLRGLWIRAAFSALVVGAALAVIVAAAIRPASTGADPGAADTVFLNGQVLLYPKNSDLMSNDVAWAKAVAVKDGVITFVGNNGAASKRIGPETEVIDLEGRMLMPGLGDGHLHSGDHSTCSLDYEGGTVEKVLDKIRDCLLRDDQVAHLQSNFRLTVGNFMGEGMLPPGTFLDRHILDRLSADPSEDEFGTGTTRPIVVRNMDFHKLYTNTKAIENAGLDENTPEPPGSFIGRDPDGYPNGQFSDFNANWGPNLPAPPDSAYINKVSDYQNANRVGITSVLHPGGSAASLQLLRRVADDGNLTVRVNQALSTARRGSAAAIDTRITQLNASRAQFDGYSDPASPGDITVDTVKIFCDGVAEFPGQTAAMLEPYRENVGTPEDPVWVPSDRRGEEPSCSDSTLNFMKLDEAKWTIHAHSLGDRAVRETLDNFEAIQDENEPWGSRHTITHMQFVDDEDIPRYGELGVVASMSLQWNQRDAWSVDGIEGYIAPDRMDNMYPARGVIEGGAVVAWGSDWPVTLPWVPWAAIEQAVTREGRANPERAIYSGALSAHQSITFPQAVKASTIGVAYQMHREDEVGSIEEGKLADLIVIDRDLRNLFNVPGGIKTGKRDSERVREAHMRRVFEANVAKTNALLTMVGGETVWSDLPETGSGNG